MTNKKLPKQKSEIFFMSAGWVMDQTKLYSQLSGKNALILF